MGMFYFFPLFFLNPAVLPSGHIIKIYAEKSTLSETIGFLEKFPHECAQNGYPQKQTRLGRCMTISHVNMTQFSMCTYIFEDQKHT